MDDVTVLPPAAAGDLRLTTDDEVALLHGPADERYRPLSEALVNIRATLRLCIQDGLLDESAAGHLHPDLMAESPLSSQARIGLIHTAGAATKGAPPSDN
ncbi:TfuA-like protein [Streptomyces lydicus]|uniref:TfuA-like protein n=1 Tax=Streptomyces lydicus TaxID=47763 RepID=UPI00379DEE69